MHFDPFWNGLAKIQNELISGWQKTKTKKCDKIVQLAFPLRRCLLFRRMTVNDTSQNYLSFIFLACHEKKKKDRKNNNQKKDNNSLRILVQLKYTPAHKLHCNSQSETWQRPLSRASRANSKPLLPGDLVT